ncbi:radical SAM protein [Cyclobacteriaceae bacterium YHN15]|jgi:MoaA/NifB/PqqE/SkfB family radical SAM enzyme|nr:radical SAM protein [Cyclobacteriaceae bacterium YHN15]
MLLKEDIPFESKQALGNELFEGSPKRVLLSNWLEEFIQIWLKVHIFFLALGNYKSFKKTFEVLKIFQEFKKKAFGRDGKRKFTSKNGKYWFGIHLPPFPSKSFDKYILTELHRYVPHKSPINAFQQVNFAITTKCPMRCEHCFEWDNLNLPETFSLKQLQQITKVFQNQGLGHISLSGGEPMIRFEEMLKLIENSDKSTQWWMITSGFNLNEEKATRLKKAGATGVIVSIDHYKPLVHNKFRGHKDAFLHGVKAAISAGNAGLLVAISVCITKENINKEFLMKYMGMARELGVDFVQWLEPKAEGHYRNKDVELNKDQIQIMEEVFEELSHNPELRDFPPVMYYGYYQRRVGCFSGGKSSFYVDAVGMVHSCPFCHSADFKITDWLEMPSISRKEVSKCELY